MRPVLIYLVIILNSSFVFVHCDVMKDITRKREELREAELLMALGGQTRLSAKEQEVNNCLMRYKFYEVDRGFRDPRYFDFSNHFFTYKDKIRKSKVYQIIRDMPKGAILHIHDMSMHQPDYLVKLTYMDHLYVCFEQKQMKLLFSNSKPSTPCLGKWQLMNEARNNSNDTQDFDAKVRKHFTMVVDNPDVVYPSITEAWTAFLKFYDTVTPLLTFRPIWEKYFYDALKEMRKENIIYVEVRSILPNLYEIDGSTYETLVTAQSYRKIITKFTKRYPDFVGAKLIYAPARHINTSELSQDLETAKVIKQNISEIFAGFDLVGQEDLGYPLIDFVNQLAEAENDLNYFFHAGETDWYGTRTDDNLVDAILLGAKRIGHAYALSKHPLLTKEVLLRDIGIEINPISNTVLSLVKDVRNHPLSSFIAQGLPVIISSDDPGIWEADLLSDDFYVAFVGSASRLFDLKLLKTFALNSLKYSALNGTHKTQALEKFHVKWNTFIDNFNCSSY